MPTVTHRAVAYITHAGRLLVFRQPSSPEAGTGVPVGTIQPGETPEAVAMREAVAETGLTALVLNRSLVRQSRDMSDFGRDEIHQRHFVHLRGLSEPPRCWRHFETGPADGSHQPILVDLFWVDLLDDLPLLVADHDALIPRWPQVLDDGGEHER